MYFEINFRKKYEVYSIHFTPNVKTVRFSNFKPSQFLNYVTEGFPV